MKISASIVIYNEDKKTLQRVIENFLALSLEKELIIVDNSPTNTLEDFCKQFNVQYLFSGKNIGFGSGHNLAFKHLKQNSDVHLIINPDTYFHSVEIEQFLLWLSSHEDVSLATPFICNPDGTVQNVVRNIPTPLGLLKRKLNINHDELAVKKDMVMEIPFAHGCFMAFQTEVFEKMRGFDECFFMYMEDVDIFIRAKRYGKTVMNSNYSIYHEFRKGSSKSFRLLRWHLSSAIKFFYKYRKINLNDFNKKGIR